MAVQQLQAEGVGTNIRIDKVRRWSDHPAVIEVLADHVGLAIDQLPESSRAPENLRLVFTTHSIPEYQVETSRVASQGHDKSWGYVEQHEFVAREVSKRVSQQRLGGDSAFAFDLVY